MTVKQIGSNMTEVSVGDKTVLVSYSTPVACNIAGEGFYRTEQRFSVTTSKHINKWLDGVNAQERPQSFFNDLLA